MSREEKAARERLETLGIKGDQLETDANKGARSPLVATYRIIIYRLQATPTTTQVARPQKSRACIIL